MRRRIRRLPSPALVISAIALIVAVGGGAFAVAALNRPKVKSISKRQANRQIRRKAPALSVLHAQSADTATTADTATNATNLDGQPASDYRLHCPASLHRGADLCFEFDERAAAPYATALQTCARAQLRLPDEGELALVFDHLGASQDFQWAVSHYYISRPNQSDQVVASLLANDSARNILLNGDLVTKNHPYRCVTSASNSP